MDEPMRYTLRHGQLVVDREGHWIAYHELQAEWRRLRSSPDEAARLREAATEILTAYDRGYVSAHTNHAQRALTALRASLPSEREGQRTASANAGLGLDQESSTASTTDDGTLR